MNHMSHMSAVARKYRRALRNETGVHFTVDELRAFAAWGALEIASRAENQELTKCADPANTPLATSGSTSGGTANPPTSGKSAAIPKHLGPQFIEALGLGM